VRAGSVPVFEEINYSGYPDISKRLFMSTTWQGKKRDIIDQIDIDYSGFPPHAYAGAGTAWE
jgi:hypothetical protein